MTKKNIKYWPLLIVLISSVCVVQNVLAATSPLDLLGGISTRMITELNRNKATLKTKPNVVYGVVNRLFLPHVDTTSMARSVLGPVIWGQATPNERQQFTSQFVIVVVRTYATALAEYNDEAVKFLPLRDNLATSARVKVDSLIIRRGAPAIPVSYRLRRVGSSWRIYDIAVEGVSLVRSYRSQFGPKVAKMGLSGLIKELQTHNARNRS